MELGADSETLEFPWAAAADGPRYYDLKRHPELLAQVEEAQRVPELGEFLRAMNAASSILEEDYLLDARYTFPDDGREPRLSDWGYGVTTCIAAMVNPFWHGDDKGPFIVVASDTLLSFGGYCSMEGMTKNKNFHRDWSAMIAGTDISQSLPVIERATEVLRGRTGKANVVRRGFKKAYTEYRREVITDTFLSSFDMTFPDFKRKGKKQLNPEIHADLSFLIKNFNLGCTFLVYGFDDEGEPHILTVSNPGKAEVYDKPGFWAIGSGKTAAISMLAALGQHPERH